MPNDTYFDNFNGVIWVQPGGPNTISYPLLCSDIDGIDEPQGDVTGRFCLNADGTWTTVNRTQGIAFLGGAANNDEECYLAVKLARALGLVFIEHQARI